MIPAGSFPGTQNFLNNAIGSENAIAQGGLMPGIQGYASSLMNQIPAPSSVGAPGGGPSALSQMNPYLEKYFNAAALPMEQQYQNVTAPNLLANFAGTGTVGGSGMENAFKNAQSGLAQGLGTLSANIYEPAWAQAQSLSAQEQMQNQALMTQSAQQAQQLRGQEQMQAQGLGAGLYGQGLNLTQEAIGNAPSLAAGSYIPSQQMYQSGQNQQNYLQSILDNAYQNLTSQGMWPFQELSMLGQGLGTVGGLGAGSQQVSLSGQGSMK